MAGFHRAAKIESFGEDLLVWPSTATEGSDTARR